jgi:hypothetical protein
MAPLAAYDESVPHPPRNAALADRFAALRELREPVDLTDVRDLVVVVSSSRGGCTLLGELLRRCPSLLALPAENNPYVVIAQLGASDPAQVVAGEIARVVGRPAEHADVAAYALEWAWRLTAQWPGLDVAPQEIAVWVREAFPATPTAVAAHVVARAREHDPRVDPRRYDLTADPAHGPPPAGPPGDLLVEMPPFVVPRPWRRARPAELATCPLVLATPRNAYRVSFLRRLFPGARLRVLHLLRNPAASINGLIDGWLHHGFFNCRVPRELAIGGYSELHPWGRSWWNYDIPPSWETVTQAPLSAVCALQWRSAHEAALAGIAESGAAHHTVRYEDLVGRPEQRRAAARRLAGWLGVPAGELEPLIVEGLAPVMATAPPRPGRWRARANALADVLADERTLALAERLGYDRDAGAWA